LEAAMPTDEEFLSFNREVIAGFRANAGVVTQPDFPILLITTTGARTGRSTTTPVAYGVEGNRVFVVASKGGAPSHPAWFHNLRANPEVTVELGAGTYVARAVPVQGDERDRLYRLLAARVPALAAYGQHTSRVFPVVVLEGVPAPDRLGLP